MVHPMNADAFVGPINRAIDSGVPVVTFAADSPNSIRRVYITSNNVNEGNVAADALCKAIGGEGEIACTENPGQSNHDLYIKSFIARVEAKWPNVKIVARTSTNQDTAKAYQSVLSILQAHPNLKAVITPEAPSAQGAVQAVKEKGGKVKVLTRDLNVSILDSIKAGDVWGAIDPDQGMQGYFGMLALFVSKHSELVDPMSDYKQKKVNPVQLPFIDNGMNVVTKENANSFYWDKYLKRRGT
jgi:ribose transport system substrate-binding protein